MIRSGRYFALALLMASAAGSVSAKVDIAFVDMEKLLKNVQADFEKERDKISKEFQAEVEKVSKNKQELEAKTADVKDKDAHKKKIEALDGEIQAKAQSSQARMMAAQQGAQKKAEAQIKKIEAIRVKNGWSVVMPTGSAVAFDKTNEVTEIIKEALDNKSASNKKK